MKKILNLVVVMLVTLTSFGQILTLDVNNEYNEYDLVYLDSDPNISTYEIEKTSILNNLQITGLTYTPDSVYIKYNSGGTVGADSTLTVTTDGTIKLIVYSTGVVQNDMEVLYFKIIATEPSTASTSEYGFDRTEMRVFPSPATTSTKVRFFAEKSDVQVDVFSLNGTLVFSDDASRNVGSMNDVDINLSNFAAGIYIARAGTETFKFVKL